MKNTFRAEIISDTISPMLEESRNSASSRARSIRDTITQVMEDPYVPIRHIITNPETRDIFVGSLNLEEGETNV